MTNYFIVGHQQAIWEHKSPWTIFQSQFAILFAGRWNYLSVYLWISSEMHYGVGYRVVDQPGLVGRLSRHRDGREIFRASEHAGKKKGLEPPHNKVLPSYPWWVLWPMFWLLKIQMSMSTVHLSLLFGEYFFPIIRVSHLTHTVIIITL